MNREEFLEKFVDILQTDAELNFDMELESIEEWDSLSKMAIMAFFKKNFCIELTLNSLGNIQTPADLIALAGDKIND